MTKEKSPEELQKEFQENYPKWQAEHELRLAEFKRQRQRVDEEVLQTVESNGPATIR